MTLNSAKPGLFPIRQRTGTAARHLGKSAVDFSAEDLEKLSPKDAVFFMANLIWGSSQEMPCTHCGTIDTHYWYRKELRWKCKCCDSKFSVTSQTVFADHKLPLNKILKIAFSWSIGASGVPALQLRRQWNVTYKTVYTLLQKLREGLLRGFNTGVLCGVLEMDGMDVNGRGHKEKRNKPQGGRSSGKPKIPAYLFKPMNEAEFQGPMPPPKFGKASKQHPDRRLLLGVSQRGINHGNGSSATRIGIAVTESRASVTALAGRYASTESTVISDEDPSYAGFKTRFNAHKTINHSERFSDGKGVSNNQAESFNWRVKRALKGIYLSASNKYLKDYSGEQAWRTDVRKLSTGKKLGNLFCAVMGVGLSQWFRGYGQGKHRDHEMLLDGPRPAKGRGKSKGWKPRPPR